jgi:hypothetical protein
MAMDYEKEASSVFQVGYTDLGHLGPSGWANPLRSPEIRED